MPTSLQAALDDTHRRREMQVEYNTLHGITPVSIAKPIVDILEGAHSEAANDAKGSLGKRRRLAEDTPHYASLNPAQAAARLKALEQQMYQHARDLEFEDAARLRDEIHKLREASPVSYTHLDVYKRQVLCRGACSCGLHGRFERFLHV